MIGQANLPSVACRGHRPSPLARVLAVLAAVMLWASGSIIVQAQQVVGPPNAILCNKTAIFSADSANTKIISGVSGQTIFVCGWNITNSASTGTVAITTGTTVTTPCDTNTVNVTPTLSVTSSSTQVDHIPYAGTSAAVAANLCVTPSATTVTGVIWYSQF